MTPPTWYNPGPVARYCHTCRRPVVAAVLERVGDMASEVTYVPHCPTCGDVVKQITHKDTEK